MKVSALLALVLALASGAVRVDGQAATTQPPASQRSASSAKVLKRAELDALLADPGKVLLIDVRRPDELASIGGFPVYLSIQAGDLDKHLSAIPKDRVIVTVSNHAARAGRAADLLAKNGFRVAGAVGAQDYEAEGGALVGIAPRAAAATQGQ